MDLLDFDDEMEDHTHEPGVISEENLPEWCLKAEEGDAVAQYKVAKYLDQEDPHCYLNEILKYSKQAVLQGYEPAVVLLAEYMEFFPPTYLLRILTNAAEKGSVEAMWRLATCLSHGLVTKPDPERAQYWYEKAAELGDGMQKVNLAIRYMRGNGVPKSMVKAMSLAHLATMNGIPNAKDLVMQGEMDSTMEAWDDRVHEKVLDLAEWDEDEYDEDAYDEDGTDDPEPVPPKPRETAQPNTAEQNAAAERKFETIFDMELTKRVQAKAVRRATIWSVFGFVLLAAEILLLGTRPPVWYLLVLFDAFAYLPIGYHLLDGFDAPRVFRMRNVASNYAINFFSFITMWVGLIPAVLFMLGRFYVSPRICRKILSNLDDFSTEEGLKNFYNKHKGE